MAITGKARKTRKGAARAGTAEKAAAPFLARGEAKPVEIVNPKSKTPVVIVCDHASRRMPRAAKNLGLAAADRKRHVAWDPGTAHIGRYLAKALGAQLHLAGYSRLVCDLNRGHDHPDCMRDVSDDVRVPGNRGLAAADRDRRLDALYWPYHDAITRALDTRIARGQTPFLLSIHSFTPRMATGPARPWHIGVMWKRQQKLAKQLVRRLRRDNPALSIGENEPYSLKDLGGGLNTIERHAEARGLPYLIVEFRQDLVAAKKDAEAWAALFLRSLLPILEDPASYAPVKKTMAKSAGTKSAGAKKKTARRKKT
jgi:predicted N-formylglutamate amidohydrolase